MSVRPTSLACSRMMTSESSGAETVSGSSGNLGSSNGNINHPTATTRTASSMPVTFKRKLGGNELYCNQCHSVNGNLNVLAGLTLLTRHAVDEGKDNAMHERNPCIYDAVLPRVGIHQIVIMTDSPNSIRTLSGFRCLCQQLLYQVLIRILLKITEIC
jgi:hypothetical protein